MSVINPTGNTGNREVASLATASAPELFDLQMRLIEEDSRLKSLGEQFTGTLMSLYQNRPINGEFETITELTLDTYGYRQPEGTTPNTARFGIGRTFNYSYDDYGVAYVATERSLMNSQRHRNVISGVMNLTRMLYERRYLDGVLRLSFGGATSYTDRDGFTVDCAGIDGLAIFSANHTLPHSATTWSNIVPVNPVLGKAGILAAENLFKTAVFDGFGIQKRISPDTLVITDDATLKYNAAQIYGSSTELGQANSSVISALPSRRIVVLPMLDADANGNYDATKKDTWILGRFGDMDGVQMYYAERYGIQAVSTFIDTANMTRNVKWGAKAGYRFTMVSGLGMVRSNGSGV